MFLIRQIVFSTANWRHVTSLTVQMTSVWRHGGASRSHKRRRRDYRVARRLKPLCERDESRLIRPDGSSTSVRIRLRRQAGRSCRLDHAYSVVEMLWNRLFDPPLQSRTHSTLHCVTSLLWRPQCYCHYAATRKDSYFPDHGPQQTNKQWDKTRCSELQPKAHCFLVSNVTFT